MVEDILCEICGNFYNVNGHYGCPYCPSKFAEMKSEIERLRKLLKMAEDELIESDNHGRAQEKRADALEAEVEQLRSDIYIMNLYER